MSVSSGELEGMFEAGGLSLVSASSSSVSGWKVPNLCSPVR